VKSAEAGCGSVRRSVEVFANELEDGLSLGSEGVAVAVAQDGVQAGEGVVDNVGSGRSAEVKNSVVDGNNIDSVLELTVLNIRNPNWLLAARVAWDR
jgi:hypothetical protein